MHYFASDDSRTLRNIGINMAILIGVALALVAVAAVLS